MHARRPAVLFAGRPDAHAAGPPSTARCRRSARAARCARTPTARGPDLLERVLNGGDAGLGEVALRELDGDGRLAHVHEAEHCHLQARKQVGINDFGEGRREGL